MRFSSGMNFSSYVVIPIYPNLNISLMVLVSARCSQYVIDCNSGKGSCCDVVNCTSSSVNGVTSSAEGLQSSS